MFWEQSNTHIYTKYYVVKKAGRQMSHLTGNKHLKVAPWRAGRMPRTTVAWLGSLLSDNPGCETCPAHIWNQSLPHTQCLTTAGFTLLSIKMSGGICANFRREVILLLTFCRAGLSFLLRNILGGAFIINLGLHVWMGNWWVLLFWVNHSFPFHEKTTVYTGWSLRTTGFIFSILFF